MLLDRNKRAHTLQNNNLQARHGLIIHVKKKDPHLSCLVLYSEFSWRTKIDTDFTKICKGCSLLLPLSRFNKHNVMKDGLRSKCIECRRLEHIAYREADPEKMRKLQKTLDQRKVSTPELREKHLQAKRLNNQTENARLKSRIRNKRWCEQNKRNRQLRIRTPSQKLRDAKSAKKWRLLNPDKANASYALRRASKRNATPPWLTKDDKEEISELFTVCQMFKMYTGQEYHVDHIVPLTNRDVCGLHIPCNLRVILAIDNLYKNNKFDETLAIDYSTSAYL